MYVLLSWILMRLIPAFGLHSIVLTRSTISTNKSRSWLMVLYRPKTTVLSGAVLNTDYTFKSAELWNRGENPTFGK